VKLYQAQIPCHVDWLLEQLKQNPDSLELRSWAFYTFANRGKNFPLAAAFAPQGVSTVEGMDFEQLRFRYHQGRLEDALAVYEARPDVAKYPLGRELLVEICLRLGRLEQAARIAGAEKKDRDSLLTLCQVAAGAAAAGDDEQARRLIEEASSLFAEHLDWLFTIHDPVENMGYNRRAVEMLADRLAEYLESANDDGTAARALLRCCNTVRLPAKFDLDAAAKRFKLHPLLVTACRLDEALRAGRCEQAASLLSQLKGSAGRLRQPQEVSKAEAEAVALLASNAKRLEGDWAALKGTLLVYDGPPGGRFAVKAAGEVLYVDPGGTIWPTGGLATDRVNGIEIIRSKPAGVLCLQGRQVFLLDEKTLRWLPSYALSQPDKDKDIRTALLESPVGPTVLRHVIAKYPCRGYDRGLLRVDVRRDGWSFWGFWGDIVIAAHEKTQALMDVSAELADRLKRARPVRVYRTAPRGQAHFICTDAGLWTMDHQGQLTHVQMPIPDNNVMVRLLDYPSQSGKVYVGVAVQQGGQMIEYDLEDGRTRLVEGGYCGFGPDDCYQNLAEDKINATKIGPLGVDHAIDALARRAGATSLPASRAGRPNRQTE
jgi:hypothetical protein